MAKIKKADTTKCRQGCEVSGTSYTTDGNENFYCSFLESVHTFFSMT